MSRPCAMMVIGCEGREQTTAETLHLLATVGGGFRCGAPRSFHWTGIEAPPPSSIGWDVVWTKEHPSGGREAFWRAWRWMVANNPGHDVVFMEDDIAPAVDALPAVAMWDCPHFTTFFNTRGWTPGLHAIDDSGYWGTQCIKFPADIIARVAAEDCHDPKWLRTPRGRIYQGTQQGDIVLGRMLRAWGFSVYQHRSLFQHTGATSIAEPGASLKGIRSARDFDINNAHQFVQWRSS